MTIGNRMKKLRKEIGITQVEFASSINVSRGTVAKYEIGTVVPSANTIAVICSEYNVNEEWLRTGEGEIFLDIPKNLESLAQQMNISDLERSIIENFLIMDDKTRAEFLDNLFTLLLGDKHKELIERLLENKFSSLTYMSKVIEKLERKELIEDIEYVAYEGEVNESDKRELKDLLSKKKYNTHNNE